MKMRKSLRVLPVLTLPIVAFAVLFGPAATSDASTSLPSTTTASTSTYLPDPSTSTRAPQGGSSWAISASKNPGSSANDLLGVSCTSPTFCMAAGAYSNSALLDDQRTLVERWNGRSWSVVASRSPGNNGDTLDSVSCASTTFCMAVGSYTNGPASSEPLVERWNGRIWAVVPNPPPPGSRFGSSLNSVSCTSAAFCMATGSYSYAADHDNTIAEEWNGKSWEVVPSPSPEISNNLLSVSCTSAAFCMTGGSYESVSGNLGALAEEWDGRTWAVVSSPLPGSVSNELRSISCRGATFCLAAGTDSSSPALSDQNTLVERWNGRSWSVVASRSPGRAGNTLDGISCATTTSCVAVGSYAGGSGYAETLVEKWSGRAWAVLPSPNPKVAHYGSYLSSAACTGASFCVAAGASSYAANHNKTLVEKTG